MKAAGADTTAAEVYSFVAALQTTAPPSLQWDYIQQPDLRHDNIYRSLEGPILKMVFGAVPGNRKGCH